MLTRQGGLTGGNKQHPAVELLCITPRRPPAHRRTAGCVADEKLHLVEDDDGAGDLAVHC